MLTWEEYPQKELGMNSIQELLKNGQALAIQISGNSSLDDTYALLVPNALVNLEIGSMRYFWITQTP